MTSREIPTVRRTPILRAAAPEGGALYRVRGCHKWVSAQVQMAMVLMLATLPYGSFAQADASLTVGPDLPAELHEVLVDAVGNEAWLRFRFVVPALQEAGGYGAVADDMASLCGDLALTYLADYSLEADVIVISLGDRVVPFGEAAPDVLQYFDAFRIGSGTCVWEPF